MSKFQAYEDESTEYKAELNDKLEKEVVAFLNSAQGGHIYIGVDDKGGIIGVAHPDNLQLTISSRVRDNIEPNCLGFYDVYSEQHDGKTIIHIVVTRGTEKTYYLKKYGLSPSGCYLRVGSGVQPMDIAMIDQLYSSRTRDSLKNIPSPKTGGHNFNQLKIYYEEKGFSSNANFLENLDLYTADKKINYVGYLFADNNSVSIKVAKYAGNNKIELIENEEYGYCSLIRATERVLDKLDIENRTFTKITGAAKRMQKRMIDPVALREALINAIVHNDYSREVTPVVEIYADRLTITSYGGLVTGLSRQEFLAGRSMPRNREIMRIFRDIGLVEHLGSGMSRILSHYPADIFKLSEHFLEVSFPFEQGYFDSPEAQTHSMTTEVKKLLLSYNQVANKKTLMAQLDLHNDEHFRKNYLVPAIKAGLLEMTLPDKPKSRLQQYRLTDKGEKVKKQLVGVKYE